MLLSEDVADSAAGNDLQASAALPHAKRNLWKRRHIYLWPLPAFNDLYTLEPEAAGAYDRDLREKGSFTGADDAVQFVDVFPHR